MPFRSSSTSKTACPASSLTDGLFRLSCPSVKDDDRPDPGPLPDRLDGPAGDGGSRRARTEAVHVGRGADEAASLAYIAEQVEQVGGGAEESAPVNFL